MLRHRRHSGPEGLSASTTQRVKIWRRRIVIMGALLTALAGSGAYLASSASAVRKVVSDPPGSVTVWGPEQLGGSTGSGTTHVERFTLTIVPGHQYILKLVNGDAQGAHRADSVKIKVNGHDLENDDDLTSSSDTVLISVALREADTLRFTVMGPSGSFVTASVITAQTSEYTINGPTDFVVATGPTETFNFSFAKPAGAGPKYRLYALNGDSLGARRADSVTFKINNTSVPGATMKQVHSSVVKEVNLQANNNIVLFIKGAANSLVRVRFVAKDSLAPVLAIGAPAANAVTNSNPVTVSGTFTDVTATSVTVNGVQATVTDNASYSASVPLPSEGQNTLTVVATDASGLTDQEVRTVTRDTQVPSLAVSAPLDNAVTKAANVTVSGTTSDATALSVNTNGTPWTIGGGGAFSGSIALAVGANVLTTTATDAAGNTVSIVRNVTRDTLPPVLAVSNPTDNETTLADSIVVSGTVTDATTVTVAANGVNLPVTSGSFSGKIALAVGPNAISVIAIDQATNADTVSLTVTREEENLDLPPDPSTVASEVDSTTINTITGNTDFLYTGEDPIQTGVEPGTIEDLRAAIIRGRVVNMSGTAVGGAQVSVLDHPEYGQTLSRADGRFDLAVNGGAQLTLHLEKEGLLDVQRSVAVAWEKYSETDDIAMMPLESQVTTVNFSQPTEVAQGNVVTDAAGSRQATLVFDQGTQATMVLPDGSTQPLSSVEVRATEYTRGDQGPTAMPGALPATSAYTYAVEMSVDEAVDSNARTVEFTTPVSFYVDNFLGIPTGARLPFGTYDRKTAKWVPEKNGRVIKILSTNPVQIAATYPDTTTPASQALLDSLGFSSAELTRLGSTYSVGKTLWRVETTHFTPGDINFAFGWPDKAAPPQVPNVRPELSCQNNEDGSIIGCEGQTLGEDLAIAGTPITLHYQSDRTAGYLADRLIEIPAQTRVDTSLLTSTRRLMANEFPSHVQSIYYVLEVAGKISRTTRSPAATVAGATLLWDGRDSYNRVINGSAKAKLSIGFEYLNNYAISTSGSASGSSFGAPPEASSIAFVARDKGALQQVWEGTLGSWDNRAGLGLGGWSLSSHHMYDPIGGTLYLGSGERRTASAMGNVAKVVPSTRGSFCSAISCGTPIFDKYSLGHIAVDASGNVLLPYSGDGSGPSAPGIIRILGPTGSFIDSIPAAGRPYAIALAPDGTMYYSEQTLHQVRRRNSNGTSTVIAGTGVAGFQGDGGSATAALLNRPGAIAIGLDGSVFVADENNHRIRRVATNGTISTYAGDGTTGFQADGGMATGTPTPSVRALTIAPDGALIYGSKNLVRRIDAGGRVSTLAGYNLAGSPGSTPARQLLFTADVESVAAESDGSVLFAFPGRVYRVTPTGTAEVIAGTGTGASGKPRCTAIIQAVVCNPDSPVDQEISAQTTLEGVVSVAVGPDRAIHLAEASGWSNVAFVRSIRPGLPGLTPGNMLIAAADGSELYEFSSIGRHLRTRDGVTGKTRSVFDYDARGFLVAIRDSLGNTTEIERNGAGEPLAIVAPFGQRTTLEVDGNGYLEEVRDPAGNKVELTHLSNGLLTELRDPRDKVHEFTYDEVGRLVADSAPNGGVKTLVRTVRDSGYTVAVTTSLGRVKSYAIELLGDRTKLRTVEDEAGLTTRFYETPAGVDSIRTPDGTGVVITKKSDPRFGPQVQFPGNATVQLPSHNTFESSMRRAAVRSDSTNPFALTQQIDSLTVNGRLWQTVFQAATQVATSTSPEGRQGFARIDSLGRLRSFRVLGIDSVSYGYDTRGRLSQVRSGGRAWSYSYDEDGRLLSTQDPLGRSDSLFYDEADRLTRRVLPGGRELVFGYDSSGNLTSVTPPGRAAHGFVYTPIDLTGGYTPPNVGLTTPATTYEYNADRQLTQIVRPDSQAIDIEYDEAHRPSTVTFDRGQLSLEYSPTTGQLANITAPGSQTMAFTYDGMLPKSVTWDGTVQGSVEVEYDSDFRVAEMTVNEANSLTFGYDGDGLLTTAGALGIKRHAQHGLPERDSLDAVKAMRSYTSRGALATSIWTSDGSTLFDVTYARDSLDRITSFTETIGGSTTTLAFGYDSSGRLEEVQRNGVVTATYEYDLNGNRTHLTTPNGTVIGTYDAQDRLTQYGSVTYAYGSAGELKTKVESGDTTRYTYDALGNLTAVALPDGTALSYLIDGQNRRIGKRVNGSLTQGFLYQGPLTPVAELNGSNQVVSRFIYGTQQNVPEYLIKSGSTYRIVTDHLGSVRLVVKTSDGSIAQRLDYDEFGRVIQNTAPGFQPFGYAGGHLDDHTGLIRFGARDYDPAAGRWTAKDPLDFMGGDPNLYAYVENDPINYVDPEGFGKVGLFVRTVKGAWKQISRLQADKLLDHADTRILVEGAGPSKKARNLAKQKFGSKKVRHDGHKPGERPHWQHKNSGRGKLMYSLNIGANLGVCTFGDNPIGNLIDFLNPLSDLNDLAELGVDLLGGAEDEVDEE